MNPTQLFDNGQPTEAWKCTACLQVHSGIQGGTVESRSESNQMRAEECCKCTKCGCLVHRFCFGPCDKCRAIENAKNLVEPPKEVEVVQHYPNLVRCEQLGFEGSMADYLETLAKLPTSERPAWCWVAERDPDGVKTFESFINDLHYEDYFPTSKLDPASIEDLRLAFDRFNAANMNVAPLRCDRKRVVMLKRIDGTSSATQQEPANDE